MTEVPPSLWRNAPFHRYLASTGFSGMAFAMQQLLMSWLLIGVLLLPADQVGLIQAAIGVPAVCLMLWGGASADHTDPRRLLIWVYATAPVFSIFLILVVTTGGLSLTPLLVWGLGLGVVTAVSMPAQQALLNRVSEGALQQGVSASTAVGFAVQMAGLTAAGQMDRIGLPAVLVTQCVCFGVAALAMKRIAAQPARESAGQPEESALTRIAHGLRATYANRTIFHLLVINFVSTIFNAGSMMTVFPFIIKRVYDGDAATLGLMMTLFFAGATCSNFLLMRLMPLIRPGRVFLLMQLTRIAILWLVWLQPSWWLLVVVIFCWGLNMGVTTTLARSIVQEAAAPAYRGRILSVFTLGLIGSAPLGALVLGWIIERFGTLNALLPGMGVSLVLCAYGVWATGLWRYRSVQA